MSNFVKLELEIDLDDYDIGDPIKQECMLEDFRKFILSIKNMINENEINDAKYFIDKKVISIDEEIKRLNDLHIAKGDL